MNSGEELLAGLQRVAGGRSRVSREGVWIAFRGSVRGYTGEVGARPALAALLAELSQAGRLRLPKARHLWDHAATPPLPQWVQLLPEGSAASRDTRHAQKLAWPPELTFVAELASGHFLDEFIAIKKFLADGGRDRDQVPLRERSLELFGDEKRLDGMLKSSAFGRGRLTLELLRCHEVAPPLVWDAGPAGSAGNGILVLENLHTYESFRRWNAERGLYCAVGYGHGSEFRATVRDLPRLAELHGTTTLLYFGDLDLEGLRIAFHADGVLAESGSALRLRPAIEYYEMLLSHGGGVRLQPEHVDLADPAIGWLPERMRATVVELFQQRKRIPQEAVGTEALAALARSPASLPSRRWR